MAEIGVKELKARASAVIEDVERGVAYIVTKRGRPAAVLLPVEDAVDLVLADADDYIRMRRDARAAHGRGSFDELGWVRLSSYEAKLSPASVHAFQT